MMKAANIQRKSMHETRITWKYIRTSDAEDTTTSTSVHFDLIVKHHLTKVINV